MSDPVIGVVGLLLGGLLGVVFCISFIQVAMLPPKRTYVMGPVRVKATYEQYERYLRVQIRLEQRATWDPEWNGAAMKKELINTDITDLRGFMHFFNAHRRYCKRHGFSTTPDKRFVLVEE